MAHFTSQQDIQQMINATAIAKAKGIKAYAFYQTNAASLWVVSGTTPKGSDYYMIDTIFDTCRVADQTEFKCWVVN